MTDVSVWYKSLPFFTKYWLTLTVGISLVARFGLLSNFWLFLDSEFVFYKFQVSNFPSFSLAITNGFVNKMSLFAYFICFSDMETSDVCIFLSNQPGYWISFYA